MELLYGIDNEDGACFTVEQAAKLCGRSTKQIRQIEAKALRTLQQPSRLLKAKELGLLTQVTVYRLASPFKRSRAD